MMTDRHVITGSYFALTAHLFWGVVPVYFKWVDHVPPLEILAHRVVWALILLVAILAYLGELKRLRIDRKLLPTIALTASLLTVNWLVFIYAVVNENIVETSLGYFINPLVSIFLGVVVLRETMRPLQWVAIGIAASAIVLQLVLFGSVPWIALALAFSFGFYGLFRKNLNLHAIGGLALETLFVAPIGLMYLFYLNANSTLVFGGDLQVDFLLALGGFVTSFPLLCFAAAVTRLPLVMMGMFQYIAPSLSLIIAVMFYNEPFELSDMITFGLIWLALVVFSFEMFAHNKRLQRQQSAELSTNSET